MPFLTTRLKLSLPLSNEYVSREVLVKAFEEIDKVVMLQGDLDTLKRTVNKYTDDSIKTLKDETENKVGKPNGIAGLDKDGKVPTTQLPKREAKDVHLADAKGYYSEKTVEFALQQVGADLAETDKKSQLLQQGLNVLNAPVASPLNIEVQGRTLVNLLGQTNLDNTKYYLFVPNKGTTKITYGGNTYEGVTKFTGQATVAYLIKQGFRGKVAGSVVENGNISKVGFGSSLISPANLSNFPYEVEYERIDTLNGVCKTSNTANNGQFPQNVFSFNIIRTLEDKFGPGIWQGKTALADKIAIAKQAITKLNCNWWGYGSSPTGNKALLAKFDPTTNEWGNKITNSTTTPGKISSAGTPNYTIGSDGFAHFLAYAEPSNGTVASVINTDYIELELEVNTSLPLLEDALYEVDQATYNKINVDPEYSGQKLLDKFPYVQGVQHLNPVMSVEGENLLPPFMEWVLRTDTKILEPYHLEISGVSGNYRHAIFDLKTIPGKLYTISFKGSAKLFIKDGKNGSTLIGNKVAGVYSFSPSQNLVEINFESSIGGVFNVLEPIITLSDKPKPFAPRDPSYLYSNTQLVGMNGVNDVLYQDDGQWKVLRKWERDVVLDGNVNWDSTVSDFNGYKMIKALKVSSFKALSAVLIKGDATPLTYASASIASNRFDFDSSGNLYISLSDMETGFGETYNPVADEVKAYFNGWKVKTSDANGKPIAWKSVVDDKDAPTQTLAYVKANRAPNYTPYKLMYQLATPRVEPVQVEGDLAVSGMTQVSVDSGVVVREKVTPIKQLEASGSFYQINRKDLPNSFTKKRLLKFLTVYKNGIIDPRWSFVITSSVDNGLVKATILENDFDSTAEYTVTYLVQDKHLFTTNPIDVKATYNQSLKTSVTELVEKQADTATGLSILVNATSENTKDIVALKKATADNTTDITELKNKMNTNSTKLDKHLESLSRFRSSKDDNGIFRTLEWKTKSGVLRRKAVITMHPTTGDYDKQTVTEYADDGKTVTNTDEYKLILDGDGDIVNEVLQ